MATLYEGTGLSNIVNIGSNFIGHYYLGKRNYLILTSSEIDDYCTNNTYITRIEGAGGNTALALLFSKNAGNNHLSMTILGDTFERDIPATTSLTIKYIPTVDSDGLCTNIQLQFIGDSFNVSRDFSTNVTFDSRSVDADNSKFDLTSEEKQSIKKIFDAITAEGFGGNYILSRGNLLYLARRSNYQSSSVNINVHSSNKSGLKSVIDNLLAQGFIFQYVTWSNSGDLATVKVEDAHARLIVKFCYEFDATNYYYYGHNYGFTNEAVFLLKKDYLDNKKTVTFKTINISVPNDHTGYLTDNYGATWNTPDPEFDRWADNPTLQSSAAYTGVNHDISTATSSEIVI